MGMVAVNESKTKYMFSKSRDMLHIGSQITADNYTFDTIKEFIRLAFAVTTKNDVRLESKRKINLANRCCYKLNRRLSSRFISHTTKLSLYKTLILPVLIHGTGAWTLWITLMQHPWKYSREKFYVRFSVLCEVAMISTSDPIVSCKSSSTYYHPEAALACPCCWNWGGCSDEMGFLHVQNFALEGPKRRSPIIGAEEEEAPGRMCWG